MTHDFQWNYDPGSKPQKYATTQNAIIMTTYLLQQNNICFNHLYLRQKNDMTFDKRHTAIRGHPKHGFFPVAVETAETEADRMAKHIYVKWRWDVYGSKLDQTIYVLLDHMKSKYFHPWLI